MACRLPGPKPLSEPMLGYCELDPWNKLQWNLNRNLYIFIQETAFENVVWKMASILSRPRCVKRQGDIIQLILSSCVMGIDKNINWMTHLQNWANDVNNTFNRSLLILCMKFVSHHNEFHYKGQNGNASSGLAWHIEAETRWPQFFRRHI